MGTIYGNFKSFGAVCLEVKTKLENIKAMILTQAVPQEIKKLLDEVSTKDWVQLKNHMQEIEKRPFDITKVNLSGIKGQTLINSNKIIAKLKKLTPSQQSQYSIYRTELYAVQDQIRALLLSSSIVSEENSIYKLRSEINQMRLQLAQENKATLEATLDPNNSDRKIEIPELGGIKLYYNNVITHVSQQVSRKIARGEVELSKDALDDAAGLAVYDYAAIVYTYLKNEKNHARPNITEIINSNSLITDRLNSNNDKALKPVNTCCTIM